MILLLIAGIVVLITLISFIFIPRAHEGSRASKKLDKANLVYQKAEVFLNAGEYDKATAAYFMVINEYPDSVYSEKSLRELASIYMDRGDHAKARYYYNRLLKKSPGIKDKEEIQNAIEKMNMEMLESPSITEDSVEYVVQAGDTLYGIARKFNTTIGLLKKVNHLNSDIIRPGQRLKIVISKFSIFVDKERNVLVLKKDGEPFKTYNVSTGKDNCTPTGVFVIEEKMVEPLWYKVGAVVSPDSDEYELGDRWMGISAAGYGIHGTSDETTIGGQVTQGCVRMYNVDVTELFEMVPSGTEVEIVDSAQNTDESVTQEVTKAE